MAVLESGTTRRGRAATPAGAAVIHPIGAARPLLTMSSVSSVVMVDLVTSHDAKRLHPFPVSLFPFSGR